MPPQIFFIMVPLCQRHRDAMPAARRLLVVPHLVSPNVSLLASPTLAGALLLCLVSLTWLRQSNHHALALPVPTIHAQLC
jgi:hypothetical protein